MMGTSNAYAGGDVDGGGSARKKLEPRLAGAPPLHVHKPHCTILREVGSRSGGGGDKDTMKDQATTKIHEHAHDKNRKTKKEVDTLFSIMEGVENEIWGHPKQLTTATEDRHTELQNNDMEVAALVAKTFNEAVQTALATVVQDELQFAWDFSARTIEAGVRSAVAEENERRRLHALRVAKRKQLLLNRRQGAARAQLRRYEENMAKAEAHTLALCQSITQADQHAVQLTAVVASDEEEEETRSLSRWANSHHNAAEQGLRTLGTDSHNTDAARVRLGALHLHRHQLQSALRRAQRSLRLIEQRGPMLKGMLSLLENKAISPEALTDSTSSDTLAKEVEPRDGEIMARLNPHASEEEAAIRFSNLDGYAASEHDPWTFYVQLDAGDEDTACHLVQMQVEDTDDDEADVEPTALLAIRSPSDTGTQPYQSMTATLGFEDSDGTVKNSEVCVDSGAASCTITLAKLREIAPGACSGIKRSRRRFTDAQNRIMPIVGWVMLTIWLGQCSMECKVYVFESLGVPFLLGTNALWENGLVIDAYNEILYSAPAKADGKTCSTALQCKRIAPSAVNVVLPAAKPAWTQGCHCRDGYRVYCDATTSTLTVQGASGHPVATIKGSPHVKLEPAMQYHTELRLAYSVTLPPFTRGQPLYLEYGEHCTDALATIEVTPVEALSRDHGLSTAGGTLVSAFNYYALLPSSNPTPNSVTLEKGMLIGYATKYEGARQANTGHGSMKVQLVSDDDAEGLAFEDGGRPRTAEDLRTLGFDLSSAIDPDCPKTEEEGGGYHLLSQRQQDSLYGTALRWWWVWARDARAPETSRLVVIDIPTGDAAPVAQKPYPIPYAYKEEVLKELRKLLESGLIEPSISAWACPILVRLKKDSKPDDIKLKIICDFKRLNQVTLPDAASLGDQDEIMDGFGGRQRYAGICDAAGGFYQYPINPADKHKTAMVLPTSLGGTSFQWRVAPYGLTRNPAGYSRGMMFALQNMSKVSLAPARSGAKRGDPSTGGCASWIDDIAMHADSFEGFVDLFEKVLMRVAASSMQLKASKCYLLQPKLEVLGYYVTPDGVTMQDDKLEALANRDSEGIMTAPSTVEEIRTFLGTVQFYRRFVPRIALLAAPMTEKLKKGADLSTWCGVQQSFEAIMLFLQSSAIVSAPDLADPLAEYVICTDACNIAAGGVLLQWQHPTGRGPGPPPGTPLRGGKGTDPLTQSWRLESGWALRTLAYYSKTFDQAQKNYPTFDQESAAILLCVRKWSKIITCRPTTIYTDSTVAASMLYKHLGPPRLQRWGMELGTFLPFLKVAYRKGVDNGMADFLSRYPTFKNYVNRGEDTTGMSEELFDLLPESVPLFTHKLGDDDAWLAKCRYSLYEAKNPEQIESIWQAQGVHPDDTGGTADEFSTGPSDDILLAANRLPAVADLFYGENGSLLAAELPEQIVATRKLVEQGEFFREQREFEWQCRAWESAVGAFETVHGRAPVLYDLCCGEGGYSRGARVSGVRCYGFDIQSKYRRRYEGDATSIRGEYTPSGMTFLERDINTDSFWEELMTNGNIGDCPPPDMINVSPPCRGDSRLGKMKHPRATRDIEFDWVIRKLKEVELKRQKTSLPPLLWQLENVPESETAVTEVVTSRGRLCGTMMGNRVFRHRVFYCNYPCDDRLEHSHDGKRVGNRGVHYSTETSFHKFNQLPEANMYGVYSQRSPGRGSLEEWHGALGHGSNHYSAEGVLGVLPLGYGRLLTAQMVTHCLNRAVDYPVIAPLERTDLDRLILERWADFGQPGFELECTTTAPWFGDTDLVANVTGDSGLDITRNRPAVTTDPLADIAADERDAEGVPI